VHKSTCYKKNPDWDKIVGEINADFLRMLLSNLQNMLPRHAEIHNLEPLVEQGLITISKKNLEYEKSGNYQKPGTYTVLVFKATEKGRALMAKYPKKNPQYKKLSKPAKFRVSRKILKLIHEGYPVKQAAAIAYKYEREHKIGPKGGLAVTASSSLKSRKAASASGRVKNPVPEMGKPRIMTGRYGKLKVYAIFNKGDWTWWILAKIPKTTSVIQMALVTSPIVPDGELGSVYKADVIDGHYINPWAKNAPVAPGYKWSDKTASNPIDDKDIHKVIQALLYLNRFPERTENIDEEILNALESEKLWNYDDGLTGKGMKFIMAFEEDDESGPD
jgi:hypothetical protein